MDDTPNLLNFPAIWYNFISLQLLYYTAGNGMTDQARLTNCLVIILTFRSYQVLAPNCTLSKSYTLPARTLCIYKVILEYTSIAVVKFSSECYHNWLVSDKKHNKWLFSFYFHLFFFLAIF